MSKEIEEFVLSIGARELDPGDKNYASFRRVFKRSNYFILDGVIMVIKISRSEKPFWGVGKKFIDLLNSERNYFLVLLTSNREGWVFNKSQINNNIKRDKWRLREADNNYKINFPLPDINSFSSPAGFLKRIS